VVNFLSINCQGDNMKFAVTFCSMDPKVEANPMWHSCVLMSKMDEVTKKLEVVDSWSFYGLPSTDDPDSFSKKMKVQLKIDVNLQGNHGKWRHEELRCLDKGEGLHGKTFELTEEQFNALQDHFHTLVEKEDQAIKEIAEFLKIKPKDKPRIYPYEDCSTLIFAIENAKAKAEEREPRLKPFDLRLGFGLGGPYIRNSQTCKSHVISALRTVLSAKQIAELTEYGKHPSVPRWSGRVEDLYFHSKGPLVDHTKKSGAKVYFREELGKDNVRLFWTIPPQEFDAFTPEVKDLFTIDEEYCDDVKKLVSKLQRLEWALYNAEVPGQYKLYKQQLIQTVIQCYEQFSQIMPKPDNKKVAGVQGLALFLLSQPRSEAEKVLMKKIGDGKMLLNALYMAMVDGWKVDEGALLSNKETAAHLLSASKEDLGEKTSMVEFVDECPEAIVSYFTKKDKQVLCRILGRNYMEPVSNRKADCESASDEEDDKREHCSLSAGIN
jgi:hypothetical protein